MPNPSQESPASFNAPKADLNDMNVLCTFKIKIEPKFGKWIHQQPGSYKIKIKMTNPSQEPPVSSKAQNEDLKDMDVLCTFKIKIMRIFVYILWFK